MPYVEYILNKDYIANYLCINKDNPSNCCEGKCYLEKQIMKSLEPVESAENNTNKKAQNKEVNEFINTLLSIPEVFEANLTPFIDLKISISSRSVTAIFIPPRS